MDQNDPFQPEAIMDPEKNLLIKYKWVRIMCDYTAEGVWDRDGRANIIDELPVNENLRQRILTWQDAYDAIDDDPWKEIPVIDWSDFAKEGLEIAKSIKISLPDWTVIYFDQQKFFEKPFEDYLPVQRPRTYFEYEIIISESGGAIPDCS